MKLQHLRFFIAVIECGGVIKAAHRLHLSQPAVSAGLKALEEELGGALFERRRASRRLHLTPAGRRFYGQAVEILKRCDTARADFLHRAERRRPIRIGVLDTLPLSAVASLLERVTAAEPDWDIALWEGSVQRLNGWLGQGRLDLAWTNLFERTAQALVLWHEALVAVVAPAHPFALRHERTIRIGELASEPFLHRSRCEVDALGRARLRAAGVALHIAVRAERDELIFRLIREGRGITLAPRSVVPSDLVAIDVTGLEVSRTIGLQWRQGSDHSVVTTIASEAAHIPRSLGEVSSVGVVASTQSTSERTRPDEDEALPALNVGP